MDDEGQYVDEELLEENEFAEEAEEEDEEEEDRDEDEDESDDDGGNEDVIVPAVRFSVSEGGIRQRRRSSLRQSETRALRVAVGSVNRAGLINIAYLMKIQNYLKNVDML